MKEKILIVLPVVPYPLDAGGSVGAFNMLKALANQMEVHVWIWIRQGRKYLNRLKAFEQALGNDCHIHYTVKKKWFNTPTIWTIYEKLSKYLARDKQYRQDKRLWGDLTYGNHCAVCVNDIINILNTNNIKIIQMEFSSTINLVYAIPENIKKVFIHHELLFVRCQRMMNSFSDKDAYDEYRKRKQRSEEINALNQYDCVITLSEVDKNILIKEGVHTRIESSPLFIPTKDNKYPPFIASNNEIVYLASGTHSCNIEGLHWFINQVHPILSKQISYKLIVIGSKWDTFIKSTTIPDNISFMGFVEDLTQAIPGHIAVIPIQSGSGMRMKILEAVNNSVPFVSTSVGAEGMGFTNGKDCFICDQPQQFADSIIALLRDKNLQESFVMASRRHYEENYSPKVLKKKRYDIINSVLKEKEQYANLNSYI